MTKVAIIAQDKFLTQWETELESLKEHIDGLMKNKFFEAEKYLLKCGLMPKDWNPETWNSGVRDGIFHVISPEDGCPDCGESHGKIEAFGIEVPKEIGEKMISILRAVQSKST